MKHATTLFVTPEREEDRFLPEGPHALAVNGRESIAWVNIQLSPTSTHGHIHVRDWETGRIERYEMPARPGFFCPLSTANQVIVGCGKEIGLYDFATRKWTPLATIPDTDPRTIINDGAMEPDGLGIIFGTKDTEFKSPVAYLYRYSMADQRITILADQQTCSNGKVFDKQGDTLGFYDIDTPTKTVVYYRMSADRQSVTKERIAVDLRHQHASPDGMTGTDAGTLIVAFYDSHQDGDGVAREYDPMTGDILNEWITPASPRVTCPTIVSHGGKRYLILTTAAEGMPAEQRVTATNAGCLFMAPLS